jgi:hypothetical protein
MPVVVLAGCARDCSRSLGGTLDALDKQVNEAFPDHRKFVVFAENGSKDGTRLKLSKHLGKHDGILLPEEALGEDRNSDMRTVRIAAARNALLAECGRRNLLVPGNFVVMADLDEVNATVAGVHTCLDAPEPWAAMFANQRKRYYDLWALRGMGLEFDAWERFREQVESGVPVRAARQNILGPFGKIRIRDRNPVEVRSAFGGLGVYKAGWLAGRTYNGRKETGWQGMECEHVPLNLSIRADGGLLFINPLMLNSGP